MAPTGRRAAARGSVSPALVVLVFVFVLTALIFFLRLTREETSSETSPLSEASPSSVRAASREGTREETRLVLDDTWDLGRILAEIRSVLGVEIEAPVSLAESEGEALAFVARTIAHEVVLYSREDLAGLGIARIGPRGADVAAPGVAFDPATGRLGIDGRSARECGLCLAAEFHRAMHHRREECDARGGLDAEWVALDPGFPPGRIELLGRVDKRIDHHFVATFPGFATLAATRSGREDRAELFAAMTMAWDEVVLRGRADAKLAAKAAALRRRLREGAPPLGATFWDLCARRGAAVNGDSGHRWPRGPVGPIAGRTAVEWWIEIREIGRPESGRARPPVAFGILRGRLAAVLAAVLARADGGEVDREHVALMIEWTRVDLRRLGGAVAPEDARRIEDALDLLEADLDEG